MATDKQLDKTRKRILWWEPTARDDEFLSTLGGNACFIIRGGNSAEVLVVRDILDRVLLSVTSDDVGEISRLYAEVRPQAEDGDESLDDLLEQQAKLEKRGKSGS
jgi:hypothetical protein